MLSAFGFLVTYILFSLIKDGAAKICAQYRGYSDVIIYINCYSECCGDWSYRYCCPSSTMNLYAISAGITLVGILIVLIASVCCRYVRRRRRNNTERDNRIEIPAVTRSAIYAEPPAYSPTDPLQGYLNSAFPAVSTDYMKPPDYQKDPPEYEMDPPTYQNATTSSTGNVDNGNDNELNVDRAVNDDGNDNELNVDSAVNDDGNDNELNVDSAVNDDGNDNELNVDSAVNDDGNDNELNVDSAVNDDGNDNELNVDSASNSIPNAADVGYCEGGNDTTLMH